MKVTLRPISAASSLASRTDCMKAPAPYFTSSTIAVAPPASFLDITLEAIKEFQVIATGAPAEFGRTAGGVVNVVTKSGTNDFFGRGFYYLQNQDLQARPHFLPEDEDLPTSGQKTFGFNVGGPIVQDRLDNGRYFFGIVRIVAVKKDDDISDEMEVARDVVDYLKEYAREKPEVAALWCLGIGFILGWKLKPW